MLGGVKSKIGEIDVSMKRLRLLERVAKALQPIPVKKTQKRDATGRFSKKKKTKKGKGRRK